MHLFVHRKAGGPGFGFWGDSQRAWSAAVAEKGGWPSRTARVASPRYRGGQEAPTPNRHLLVRRSYHCVSLSVPWTVPPAIPPRIDRRISWIRMPDEVELTIVTLVFETSDPERLLPGAVEVRRGEPRSPGMPQHRPDAHRPRRPGRFVIIEKWESAEAQQAHFDSPDMVEMAEALHGSADRAAADRPARSASAPTTWPEPGRAEVRPRGLRRAAAVGVSDSSVDVGPGEVVARSRAASKAASATSVKPWRLRKL